ncbi:MAG: NifB/NifX family molybdenum-iron cluster-binding protein [Deltaproteobacteria bacterium]|nr:NifB/NifX family molybdenum-iron cluster-binding protein [Deltaproteobacteria bacterium]
MTDKIAISVSSADGLVATMDMQFGRAPFFLLVDGETHSPIKTLSNDASQAVQGAGTRVAVLMAQNDVTDVISGQFGPSACTALEELNVRMWTAPSGLSAQEALLEFSKGNLSRQSIMVMQ